MEKEFYHRNLPHIQPEEGVFFITFRLDGSLPREVIEQLILEREIFRKTDIQNVEGKPQVYWDHFFEKFDSLLDNPDSAGPVWLKNSEIAQIISRLFIFLMGRIITLFVIP